MHRPHADLPGIAAGHLASVLAALLFAAGTARSLEATGAGRARGPEGREGAAAGGERAVAAPGKQEDAAPGGGETEPAGGEAREAEPGEEDPSPLLFLRDGSKVAGRLELETLQVTTRYGELRVPLDELVRVRFATRVPLAVAERVDGEIGRLGSDDYDERESAFKALLDLGPQALPGLERLLETAAGETRLRAEELVEKIRKARKESAPEAPGPELEMPPLEGEDDEVVTSRFTVKGHVGESSFPVHSRYGLLRIDVADVVGIDFRHGGKVSRSVEVKGTWVAPARWLNTRVALTRGERLKITASGEIHVSNYNITCGPEGTTRISGSGFGNFPVYSLVGRVGSKGKPFGVGRQYRGKAAGTGFLELAVVPYRRETAISGSFKVKVEAGGQ